jgi:flagellar biosynthetic protein FliP
VTTGSFVGMLGMLGLVLGLLLITLKLLKRFVPAMSGTGGKIPFEIVQRLPLGPRQGLAIVKIGDRLVTVSVGEGGVRRIGEVIPIQAVVGQPSNAEPAAPTMAAARAPAAEPVPAFRRLLGAALKQNVGLVLLFMLGAGVLGAQQTKAAPVQAAPQQSAAAKAAVAPINKKAAAVAGTAKAATATTPATAPAASTAGVARADTMISRLAPRIDLSVGDSKSGGLRLSGTVGVVVMMGLLTLIPTLVLMMTGFTRILIVLHFLRQAIGAQSAPPAQLVAGLALLLTGFVMAPTLSEVNRTALEPWMDGKLEQTEMLSTGVKPFRAFMLRQTREHDLSVFMNMSRLQPVARAEDVPLVVLMSAFVTSELRVSFQIGFALFLPFIVIDVVVASVLMSMGMMMVPPAMISLPFKLLLFVLVDGWALIVQSLVQSFR